MLHHVVLESSILLCFIKVHWKHVGLVKTDSAFSSLTSIIFSWSLCSLCDIYSQKFPNNISHYPEMCDIAEI